MVFDLLNDSFSSVKKQVSSTAEKVSDMVSSPVQSVSQTIQQKVQGPKTDIVSQVAQYHHMHHLVEQLQKAVATFRQELKKTKVAPAKQTALFQALSRSLATPTEEIDYYPALLPIFKEHIADQQLPSDRDGESFVIDKKIKLTKTDRVTLLPLVEQLEITWHDLIQSYTGKGILPYLLPLPQQKEPSAESYSEPAKETVRTLLDSQESLSKEQQRALRIASQITKEQLFIQAYMDKKGDNKIAIKKHTAAAREMIAEAKAHFTTLNNAANLVSEHITARSNVWVTYHEQYLAYIDAHKSWELQHYKLIPTDTQEMKKKLSVTAKTYRTLQKEEKRLVAKQETPQMHNQIDQATELLSKGLLTLEHLYEQRHTLLFDQLAATYHHLVVYQAALMSSRIRLDALSRTSNQQQMMLKSISLQIKLLRRIAKRHASYAKTIRERYNSLAAKETVQVKSLLGLAERHERACIQLVNQLDSLEEAYQQQIETHKSQTSLLRQLGQFIADKQSYISQVATYGITTGYQIYLAYDNQHMRMLSKKRSEILKKVTDFTKMKEVQLEDQAESIHPAGLDTTHVDQLHSDVEQLHKLQDLIESHIDHWEHHFQDGSYLSSLYKGEQNTLKKRIKNLLAQLKKQQNRLKKQGGDQIIPLTIVQDFGV